MEKLPEMCGRELFLAAVKDFNENFFLAILYPFLSWLGS
jgi:hypothetical protein